MTALEQYERHRQIVWLASYPKSGNTWVRCFLDAYLLQEVDINDLICSVTDDRADRHQIGDGSNIVEHPLHIQQLARPMSLVRLVRTFLDNSPTIPLFVKTHSPNLIPNGIELLPASLTKATVFIVRDPRDVAPSFAKHMGTDLDTAIEWMDDQYRVLKSTPIKAAELISSWRLHTESFLAADAHNVRMFRYEDMRADPVGQFSEIVTHAGLPLDRERVADALELVKLDRLQKQEREQGFRESSPHAKNQFFGQGAVGGYKQNLTPAQRRRIEAQFGRAMRRLGYIGRAKAA